MDVKLITSHDALNFEKRVSSFVKGKPQAKVHFSITREGSYTLYSALITY